MIGEETPRTAGQTEDSSDSGVGPEAPGAPASGSSSAQTRSSGRASRHGISRTVRSGIEGIGPFGRVAMWGLGLSAVVAVVLGFVIPAAVRSSLLDGELQVLAAVVADADERGVADLIAGDDSVLAQVEHLVEHRIVGGRTVRVKVLDRGGRVVFSDARDLVGLRFPLSAAAENVLRGTPSAITVDPANPENADEVALGDLFEFILPVRDGDGRVVGLMEFYQPVAGLTEEVAHLRRIIWLAIGSGLGLSALFTASITLSSGRIALRRHRQAEDLLERLLDAEEAERRRVVGALHNDVGQPLYRILFGLQTVRRRLGPDHSESEELAELERLARGIDRTLRSEFNVLYRPKVAGKPLREMFEDLVERVSTGGGTLIVADVEIDREPAPAAGEAIYRAAEEALANVERHAHAGSVWLSVGIEGGRLVLTVEDDGVGSGGREGLGLLSTRERLEAIGGGLEVRSRKSVGTYFAAWVPAGEIG